MNAALLQKLIEAGTPAELVAEVAMELSRAQAAVEILETRRRNERERKSRSREVTHSHGKSRDSRDKPDKSPKVSPKEINQTPSYPPVQVSEPSGSSPSPRPWALPEGVSLQVWTDLLSNRKRKRLGNTPTAWKQFCDDLNRVSLQTGIPPPELIRQCAAKGWGAIYDPRDQRNERSSNPIGDALQRLAAN